MSTSRSVTDLKQLAGSAEAGGTMWIVDEKRQAVREMLAALETATLAGQHHLMKKVLGVLGQEAFLSQGRIAEPQRRALATSIEALAREASRRAPDEAAFARTAAALVDGLPARSP
jgi:hypothetical protein